jgi:hypothetical protein
MEQRDWPVSVLWGLRSRYGRFGWEYSGTKYELTFTRRAFGGLWDRAAEVTEVDPRDAAACVEDLYAADNVWVRRSDVPHQLLKAGLRVWTAPGAYVCGERTAAGLSIHESHSHGDSIPSLIAGVMRSLRCNAATLFVGAEDPRLEGLWQEAAGWRTCAEGCFRINDSVSYLGKIRPLLETRLAEAGAGDFELSVRVERDSGAEQFAVRYGGGSLAVSRSTGAPDTILASDRWVRALLGGPPGRQTGTQLGPLAPALPLPLHVPLLDHI